MKVELSVVVPVLNEELNISELISRITQTATQITSNYEIIIIDDGSSDNSWSKIKRESLINNKIKGIKLSRNFGHHSAITAGLEKSNGDWIVVMDGDLQDQPEGISKLYNKTLEGFDIVFVSRQNRTEKIHYKILQKIFYKILNKLSGVDYNSSFANFSIVNRKVVDAYMSLPEQSRFYMTMINWLGFNKSFIFLDQGERKHGRPSYTFKKRVNLAIDILLSFSDTPLRLIIRFGLLTATISFFSMLYIVFIAIIKGFTSIGWASLMASVLFSTGIIVTSLGIVGAYVGKIFIETKKRPIYIISEIS